MHLRGNVAIVTGGTRGIGKAIVEAILRRGGKVCFTGVNAVSGKMVETTFNETYGPQSALFVRCDVTNDMEFQELFVTVKTTFRKLDIVVNNAGILNEDTWEKMIDINLNGTVRGTRLAIENMRKDTGGSGGIILNISSLGGIHPAAFHPAYCATKFGIVGYTRSWAVNPRVNEMGLQFATLCPAFCETDMATEAFLTGTSTNFLDFDGCMDTARDTKARLGVNSMVEVARVFLEIVEKDNCNGDVVTLVAKEGTEYLYRD